MKLLKIIAVSVLAMPIMVLAQTATSSLPNPGLTPDSPFYFLNRVSEALQEFFTFNPEAKARLELQFSAERISEIKAMLAARGATAPGIGVAKTILNENLAKAVEAVTAEKSSGKDATNLAKEVSDEISSQKLALSGVFSEKNKDLLDQEKSVKEKIEEADKKGDAEKAKELVKNLSNLEDERDALKKHDDESSQEFDNEDNNVDNALELKDQAQNAIDDVKKERAELLVENPTLTDADLALADKAIAGAEELFAKENYQAAKELAHQAEKALEKAKNANEKEMEKELEKDNKVEELIKKYEDRQGTTTMQNEEINQEEDKNSDNENSAKELRNNDSKDRRESNTERKTDSNGDSKFNPEN